MKKSLLLLLLLVNTDFAQQAAAYFPSDIGHKWLFKVSVLDSLNNEIDSSATYRIDSLSASGTYNGMSANFILSKNGAKATVQRQPFIDTDIVNLTGADGNSYFKASSIKNAASVFDSVGAGGAANLLRTLKSFEKWYSIYRFSSTVNLSYSVFKYDTTLTIDTIPMPMRFELKGTRLGDKGVITAAGTFSAKRFLMTFTISYLVTIPPFPTVAIPIASIVDTTYIAPLNWVIERISPTTIMDFSKVGKGSYTVPGSKLILISEIPSAVRDNFISAEKTIELFQNYPNPFNPSTKIKFNLSSASHISLCIYDINGKVVSELADRYFQSGSHELMFDGSSLVSGVYLAVLKTGSNILTQKIVLMK